MRAMVSDFDLMTLLLLLQFAISVGAIIGVVVIVIVWLLRLRRPDHDRDGPPSGWGEHRNG